MVYGANSFIKINSTTEYPVLVIVKISKMNTESCTRQRFAVIEYRLRRRRRKKI